MYILCIVILDDCYVDGYPFFARAVLPVSSKSRVIEIIERLIALQSEIEAAPRLGGSERPVMSSEVPTLTVTFVSAYLRMIITKAHDGDVRSVMGSRRIILSVSNSFLNVLCRTAH